MTAASQGRRKELGQDYLYPVSKLADSIATHGIAPAGVIVDVPALASQNEIRRVATALAALPSSAVSAVALTDTDVLFAGAKDEAVRKMISKSMWGGGTDFERAVSKAWAGMNKPPALILISDGKPDRWPQPFPVPTVLLLVDSALDPVAPASTFSWSSFCKHVPTVGKDNVLAIEKVLLPQIQNLQRGLE